MIKKFAILTFCCLGFLFTKAQVTDTIRLSEMSKGPKIVTDRAPQALYFQLGGSGPILSANYDRRFAKTLNGAGFAVGLGYWNIGGESMFSVPVSLNYLFGRKSHFIEIAGGTTFISASVLDWTGENENETGFIHHINLGYRHQPAAGGFFFRGGFSPLFYQGEANMSFYLGFGYNF
jgi:hypothetical protein